MTRMATACFLTPYSRVKLHSEHLEVFDHSEKGAVENRLAEVPLEGLDRIIVSEQVSITIPAIAALARRNVPVHFLDSLGHALADCLPVSPPAGETRLAQYAAASNPGLALPFSRALVLAKLANQYRVVQRLELNRPRGLETDLVSLREFQDTATATGEVAALRGVEGAGSALFFRLWAQFLPEAFPFERRSRRPPHNPVNACLSFGATLLYQEIRTALHVAGLDTALGFLHVSEDGRHALALDVMEPFRPVVPEALTLRLFNLGLLSDDHFEPSHGGIYLNTAGRRVFLQQYEQRLTREFTSEHVGHRTTLRQQFRDTALSLKAALHEPALFRPFRLN